MTTKVQEIKTKKESSYGKKGSRFNNSEYDVFKNHEFNTKNIPFGFNWALGYSEKSNIYC